MIFVLFLKEMRETFELLMNIIFFWGVTGIIDILLETNIKSIRVGRPTTSHDRFLVPVHLRCLNRHLDFMDFMVIDGD